MEKKLYRPSNGTEGVEFQNKFCYSCIHYKEYAEGYDDCELGILGYAELYDIYESAYPKEWCYNEKGKPVCTAFEKDE